MKDLGMYCNAVQGKQVFKYTNTDFSMHIISDKYLTYNFLTLSYHGCLLEVQLYKIKCQ